MDAWADVTIVTSDNAEPDQPLDSAQTLDSPQTVESPSSSTQPVEYRIARACDRCRVQKARCDDQRPHCARCVAAGLECQMSYPHSLRKLPKNYTELLEQRVLYLERKKAALIQALVAKAANSDLKMTKDEMRSARDCDPRCCSG